MTRHLGQCAAGRSQNTIAFNPTTRLPHYLLVVRLHRIEHAQRTPPSEAALIEACRRGDRDKLQTLFSMHAAYLERLLIRIAGPDMAKDLLQSTFVAAIDAFPRFRGEAQVRTWLSRIAIRTAQRALRRAEVRRRAADDPHELQVPAADLGPEHNTEQRLQLARLETHLACIGQVKRMAFVLHAFEGHSMEEVAALMGSSVSATKSRVFWARKELFSRVKADPLLRGLLPASGSRP